MHYLLTLYFTLFCMAASAQKQPLPTYTRDWQKADSLAQKGLPQSALTIVEQIYQRAKAGRNEPQLVKAALYRLIYQPYTTEDTYVKAVRSLRQDITATTASAPARSVLQSVLAETYWKYYQQNRWKFHNRTAVEKTTGTDDDPLTWDLRRLVRETVAAYEASLRPADVLKKTPVSAFDVVIQKGDADARPLRPTLYDFLAHRALSFYSSTEPNIVRPGLPATGVGPGLFVLNQPVYLASWKQFVATRLTTTDSLSLKFKALALYQALIAFHQSDKDPLALVDADLARLDFVYRNGVLPDKFTLYQQTLEEEIRRYRNSPADARYSLALAQLWTGRGNETKAGDWRRKAVALLTGVIERFPKLDRETANARHLLEELNRRTLTLTVEGSYEPRKPVRASVTFRNTASLHYRIVRVSSGEESQIERRRNPDDGSKLARRYLSYPAVSEATVKLPDDGDLQEHRTEIALPALPIGHYVVLTTTENQLTESAAQLQHTELVITNLSYLLDSQYNRLVSTNEKVVNYPTLYVIDRQTGRPLENVRVQVMEMGSSSGAARNRRGDVLQTDARGTIRPASALPPNKNYQFRISIRQDTIYTESFYNYRPAPPAPVQAEKPQALLFTDRAIYRPGQTIYFKGVLYSGKDNNFAVVPDRETSVTLLDANAIEITTLNLKSDEFGTVEGQFTAPAGRLTGSMLIRLLDNQTWVRVEEYKRPTFEVVVAPVRGSYKLGQSVQVRADAKTFAGAVVDGAQVRYRVVRRLRPLWSTWWWRGPAFDSPEAEIANGTLTTDATGAFSITFPAQPDLAVDRATKPIFDFAITFDVTDRSGETRSASRTLGIGYSAIKATLTLPEQVENRDQRIGLRISNAGGERVNTTGTLTIYPLDAPRQPLRKRRWQEPDRFALTRDAFKKLFPNDVYADEDQITNWPRRPAAAQVSFDKTMGDSLLLPLSRIPAGVYAAEVTATDSLGESVTQTEYFTIVTPEHPVLATLPDGWVRAMQTEVKPGSTATFWLASEAPAYVLMQVLSYRGVESARWITLNRPGQPIRIDVPVVAAWNDQFTVAFTKVQAGELLQESKFIAVSNHDKQLTVETLTFRDKLKPGQPEEWTLRISGPGQEKVLAEAVATLYDASLDGFAKLDWSTRSEYIYRPAYHLVPNWSRAIFGDHASSFFRYQPGYDNQPGYAYLTRSYDALVGDKEGAAIGLGGRGRTDAAMRKSAVSMGFAVAAAPKADEEAAELNEVVTVPPKGDNLTEENPNPRRNFNETAFFFPTLHTDEQGRILLKFTMPEALTRWRLLLFAHTKDMKIGSLERTVVTQKELMITANAPRFLREGDTLRLTARINNLSGKSLSGAADLLLTDAQTGKPLTLVNVKSAATNFTLAPGLSTAVGWTFVVPIGLEAVTYRLTARSGQFTDGEEQTVPVLPNRMLVTDTQPFYLSGAGKKEITLPALTKQNPELPFDPERLTVELTATPVWTTLQSLPYLAEYPYECAEQLFSRFYANTLAAQIVQAKPEIRAVVEQWQNEAQANPLEANAELKSVTLDETPWRRSARTQQEQQAQLGRFLDEDQLWESQQVALVKLQQLQLADGGFTWFAGMPVDPTVTLHILAGLGHLNKLGVTLAGEPQLLVQMMQSGALRFADAQARQWIERQKQAKSPNWNDYWPVQYLYARSFYVGQSPIDKAILAAVQNGVTQNWLRQSIQGQAMTALALHRLGDRQTPAAILKSLRERAAQSSELGMYWPANKPGYFWQQAPIETQALLIEAFDEIAGDRPAVNAMKQWLLSQKRTQAWPSTKATTEAIYALLLRGDDWLDTKPGTELSIGGKRIDKTPEGVTGYQKITYAGADVKPALGVVTVTKTTDSPAWGGIYYQHFLPLDQVPNSTGDLSVTKMLYVRRDTPNGPTLSPVTAQTTLKPGDEVVVRLIVRNDRDMQYVHLKDSRASGFEPVTALSGYKFQNGLGYYEAPRDASTDFYLSYMAAGTHVFEYPLRAFHAGDFSSGVATVQCFYAPEFSAHSTGGRVKVGEGK